MKLLITGLLCIITLNLFSQNLVVNGDFSAANAFWNNGGCAVEVNTQAVYGGSSSDLVAEIDAASCAMQTICIVPGLSYTLSFDAGRRTGGGCAPATVGMNIRVTGVTSAVDYVNVNSNYSNAVFNLANETYTFTAGATDQQVTLQFSVFNNATTCGVILNNASLIIDPAIAISGPSVACTGQTTDWLISNITGGSGVTYNWSFGGGVPASSSSATPTGVTWSTMGIKTISCQVGNGACTVTTLNALISISCILPVRIINFSAASQDNKVLLRWMTATEINNKHFRVQRSANGRDFYDMGIVNAGNGNYSFTDSRPLPVTSFYRLMQVDNDGRSSVSNIIKLTNGHDAAQNLVLYTNPVNDKLVFTYHASKNTGGTVKLYDLTGRLMQQTTVSFTNGYNSNEINIQQLAKGVYLLEVQNGTTQEKAMVRFMKN